MSATVFAFGSLNAQGTDSTRVQQRRMMRDSVGGNARMEMRRRMMRSDATRPAGRDGFGPRGMREQGRRGVGPSARGRGAMGMRMGREMRGNTLLRGITLSGDQEKALRAVQARHIQQGKPLMMDMLSARTDEQLARLNGDQKALDAATARMTATRTRLDSLRSNRGPTDDLRSVLTPDQQKLLDRNLSEQGSRRPGGMRMGPDAMKRRPGGRGLGDGPPGPTRRPELEPEGSAAKSL
ncbi:MAG: Spy/CpxP family protein refolding chaperone [Gemmatimonadaceae bacterium]